MVMDEWDSIMYECVNIIPVGLVTVIESVIIELWVLLLSYSVVHLVPYSQPHVLEDSGAGKGSFYYWKSLYTSIIMLRWRKGGESLEVVITG